MNTFLPFSPNTDKTAMFQGQISIIITEGYCFTAPKKPVLFNSMSCDRRKSVTIFGSTNFLVWLKVLNKMTDQSKLCHQNLMKVGVYFDQQIQSNIYCDQADSLQQILRNIIIFKLKNVYSISNLVVMTDKERKQCHFCFKAICGPTANN